MSEKEEKLAEYFRSNCSWERTFRQLRNKWETYGRIAGSVVLKDAAPEEKKAVSGLLGRNFENSDLRFSVREFTDALEHSRYMGVDYYELLEHYFGEKIATHEEKRKAGQSGKEEFYQGMLSRYDGSIREWLEKMLQNRQFGYKNMEQMRKQMPVKDIQDILDAISEADYYLQSREHAADRIPLAVLAARVSDDPHFLDRGSTAGTLLNCLLCFEQGADYPGTAQQWKQLLLVSGIQTDEISSTVMTYGLHVEYADGPHPGIEGFYRIQEPLILSTMNLQDAQHAYSDSGRIFTVENEMVFAYLVKQLQLQRVPFRGALLCTSGQLRTASWELLALLVQSGEEIFYSGDTDPEGMSIADRIWQRWPEHVKLIAMEPADYRKSVSGCELNESRLAKLEHLKNETLRKTAECVQQTRRAGYQENILDGILQKILKLEADGYELN